VPLTVPVLLNVTAITPDDCTIAQTLAARKLRLLMLLGRGRYAGEWVRFQRDAPPFVVRGLEELMTAWQKLENGQQP